MGKAKGTSINAARTEEMNEAAKAALERAATGDGRKIERDLRGERLRQGWVAAIPVRCKNGEEWLIAGAPMDPEQAEGFYEAIEAMQDAEGADNLRDIMRGTFDVALYLLKQTYPALTREVAAEHVIDPPSAKRIQYAALNGTRPPEMRDIEVDRTTRAIKYLLRHKEEHGDDPKRMAEMIVDWRPSQDEETAAKN